MVEQADVYIKNTLLKAVGAIRYLPNGDSDLEITIEAGLEEKISLLELGVSLKITPPNGERTDNYKLVVEAEEGLIEMDVETTHWTIRISDNPLPPETPTTVNISIGTNGP